MQTGPTQTVPDLAELQRRAAERAAARAGGDHLRDGHIVCAGLVRIYKSEGIEVFALQGLDLVVDRGEMVAVVGASGRASPRCSTSSRASTRRPRVSPGWAATTC
jgi:hypothetical protein